MVIDPLRNIWGFIFRNCDKFDLAVLSGHFGKLCENSQPARTQNHSQAQKDGQTDPGDAIQGGFCTAGAAEHGAPARSQASHAAAFGAVKQHQYDQQYAGADPGPGQDRSEH